MAKDAAGTVKDATKQAAGKTTEALKAAAGMAPDHCFARITRSTVFTVAEGRFCMCSLL